MVFSVKFQSKTWLFSYDCWEKIPTKVLKSFWVVPIITVWLNSILHYILLIHIYILLYHIIYIHINISTIYRYIIPPVSMGVHVISFCFCDTPIHYNAFAFYIFIFSFFAWLRFWPILPIWIFFLDQCHRLSILLLNLYTMYY